MDIKVQIKKLGKKHPTVEPKLLKLNTTQLRLSLAEFIRLVVAYEVAQFHAKAHNDDSDGTPKTVNSDYLDVLSQTGKAGFGGLYNHTTVDLQTAQDNAIQAFADGLFAVFCNDEPLDQLDDIIALDSVPTFTFVRLTFLAGGYF